MVRTRSKNETYCTTFCEPMDSVVFARQSRDVLGVRIECTERIARSRLGTEMCRRQQLSEYTVDISCDHAQNSVLMDEGRGLFQQ